MLAHRFAFSLSWFFLLRQQRRSGGVVVDAIDGARSPFKWAQQHTNDWEKNKHWDISIFDVVVLFLLDTLIFAGCH